MVDIEQDLKLVEWLDDQAAQRLWTNGSLRSFTLEAWNVRGIVVIIQRFEKGGWDVYMPVTSSNEIAVTLRAIEQQLNALKSIG